MAKEDETASLVEQALLRAAHKMEAELGRIVKSGEDDLDRLVRRFAEAIAKVAIDHALGHALDNSAAPSGNSEVSGSVNQIASAIAKAARRGTRFT